MLPPKSMTAVVHVRFQEPTGKPPAEEEIELLNRVMGQDYELDPELKKVLDQFANHLNKTCSDRKRW